MALVVRSSGNHRASPLGNESMWGKPHNNILLDLLNGGSRGRTVGSECICTYMPADMQCVPARFSKGRGLSQIVRAARR